MAVNRSNGLFSNPNTSIRLPTSDEIAEKLNTDMPTKEREEYLRFIMSNPQTRQHLDGNVLPGWTVDLKTQLNKIKDLAQNLTCNEDVTNINRLKDACDAKSQRLDETMKALKIISNELKGVKRTVKRPKLS